MFKEWLRAMQIFLLNGYQVITKDVNNRKFSKKSIFGFHGLFILLSLLVVLALPQGINDNFIDYITEVSHPSIIRE